MGDCAHPEGVLTAQGVANPADLLLEGCGAATPQAGPERGSAEPRKARFFAEQKMRPNNTLQGEALYPYNLRVKRGIYTGLSKNAAVLCMAASFGAW
jgi:hypothetical protein